MTLLSDVDGTSASTSPLPLAGEGTVREARPLAPSKDFTGGSGRSGLRARSAGFLIRDPSMESGPSSFSQATGIKASGQIAGDSPTRTAMCKVPAFRPPVHDAR